MGQRYISSCRCCWVVAALLLVCLQQSAFSSNKASVEAFQVGRTSLSVTLSSPLAIRHPRSSSFLYTTTSTTTTSSTSTQLSSSTVSDDDDDDHASAAAAAAAAAPSRRSKRSRLRRKLRFGLAVIAGAVAGIFGVGRAIHPINPSSSFVAHASAPVMALPKAEGRDPATEALGAHERKQTAAKQRELTEFAAKAREIEATQGEAARIQFEADYKKQQEETAANKKAGLVQLKRDLLDQGLCPFTDLEGQRQVILYTKGVDLGNVPGTQFHLQRTWEQKTPAKSMKVQKAMQRRVIQAMVQDMKNRGIDPLDYFEKHQDQTETILHDMSTEQATRLVQQYEQNLQLYGQITVPKEGEVPAKELMAAKLKAQSNDPAAKKLAKQQAKEEAARAKAEAKAAKQKAKEEAARAKAEAKAAQQKAKQQEKQAAAVAAAAVMDDAVASLNDDSGSNDDGIDESSPSDASVQEESAALATTTESVAATAATAKSGSKNMLSIAGRQVAPSAAAAATIVVAGGGGYAIKVYRDRADAAEEQRQREFMRLMGQDPDNSSSIKGSNGDTSSSSSSLLVDETKSTTSSTSSSPPPAAVEAPVAPKKKRLGLKSVFGKKSKNNRETDLSVLVAADAPAAAFTTTLAKMLTHGAPGRFPTVEALPGTADATPLDADGKFQLDAAKEALTEAQQKAGLTLEASAEIFANVVNCMLIDIVDLASTSLKEKDNKVTVNAINIVVDFMNHAASLYSSIAEGVPIQPVTYGGSLGRSKLEQMYSEYAGSAMLDIENVPDDFDSRVSLLQDVFEIPDKKAEGLMMRVMQKNMAEAMKDPKKMEEMQEMMKGMEGMEDMASLMGGGGLDGETPDPEQLKKMLRSLKDLKESGTISPDEFENVKKEFKEMFGTSIDDVVKEANSGSGEELDETDKELLDLMKAIMD